MVNHKNKIQPKKSLSTQSGSIHENAKFKKGRIHGSIGVNVGKSTYGRNKQGKSVEIRKRVSKTHGSRKTSIHVKRRG